MDLPSVLVVGSDPECRRTLADVLGLWGVKGIFASTISDSRKILLEQSIGLVFCEKYLPDGGLTDLLDAVASSRPPVRLIAMLHDASDYVKAIRLGAFEAVLIPCHRPDVQWVIIQATRAEQTTPPDPEGLSNPGVDSVQDSIQGVGNSRPISDPPANHTKVASSNRPLLRQS